LKIVRALINSNIYISLAAVAFTIEAQIQLGLKPQWHPYLFIIFFATFFEYNLHRFITVITNKEALNSDKHKWVKTNLKKFYALVILSIVGFIVVALMAKREVLMALAPIALITLFYSTPIPGNTKALFRLREIPYVKIFLISAVWSSSTILLPIIQSGLSFSNSDVIEMLVERFFFVFAIAIPFDIRDAEADKRAGLKTIPLLINKNRSMSLSYLFLLIFYLISTIHYFADNSMYIIYALSISTITTFIFLINRKIKRIPYYYYGVLDGTILLQGLLVIAFYYL